jgi:hypothetical protein
MYRKQSMSMIALFVTMLSYAPTTPFVLCAQSSEGQSAPETSEQLLQRAVRLTDILSGDIPSYRLTARVEAYDGKGPKKEGTYTLLWNSPTIWRDETTFLDYSQIRVARIDKLLISRNPQVISEQAFRVGGLFYLSLLLRTDPKVQVHKFKEKRNGGSSERIIEITISGRERKTVYLDGSVPVPIRIEYKGAANGSQYPYKDFDFEYQFGDYIQFHGLKFPRSISVFEANVLKYRLQVQELGDATYRESDFVPPADSHWIRWCRYPERPKLESPSAMNPALPPQLHTGMPSSHAVISGIIATDGQWHNLEVIKSAGSTVDSFWMNLLRRQRFQPAQCGQHPVELEMMMEFDYP